MCDFFGKKEIKTKDGLAAVSVTSASLEWNSDRNNWSEAGVYGAHDCKGISQPMISCPCEFEKTSRKRHSILTASCFLHNRQEVETMQKAAMGNISWRTHPHWSASSSSVPPAKFPEQPKLRPPSLPPQPSTKTIIFWPNKRHYTASSHTINLEKLQTKYQCQ